MRESRKKSPLHFPKRSATRNKWSVSKYSDDACYALRILSQYLSHASKSWFACFNLRNVLSAIGRSGAAVSSICKGASKVISDIKHKQDALHLQRNAVNSTVETSLASEGMDSGWSRRRLHWWIASSSLMIAGRPVPYAILKTRQWTVTKLQGRKVNHTDVPSNITESWISAPHVSWLQRNDTHPKPNSGVYH